MIVEGSIVSLFKNFAMNQGWNFIPIFCNESRVSSKLLKVKPLKGSCIPKVDVPHASLIVSFKILPLFLKKIYALFIKHKGNMGLFKNKGSGHFQYLI